MAQLRERRKEQTRQAIANVATRLFIERGFERTTIAEVARAAGVSKMTVTNHFPRKEDLFFDMHEQLVLGPARTVDDRAPGESALAALRRAYREAVARRDPLLGHTSCDFARLIDDSPVLRARLREIFDHQEQALSAALAVTTGSGPYDMKPRIAAAQLGGVHRVLWYEAQRLVLAGMPKDGLFEALGAAAETAFDLLDASLGDYAVG